MCDPSTIVAAIGVAASVAGTAYSVSAQNSAANAQRQANDTAINAQNTAFWQKATAQNHYTANQQSAYDAAHQAEQSNNQGQQDAVNKANQDRAQVLQSENDQAQAIRSQADQQQQKLLDATNATNLAGAQAADYAARSSGVDNVSNNIAAGSPFDGQSTNGSSTTQNAGAVARAANQVRSYGQQLAKVASYTAPLNAIGDAVQNNAIGIMPAATANQLLQSGQNIRLLPEQQAIQNAQDLHSTVQTGIDVNRQGALNVAKAGYDGGNSLAGLQQGNATTIANNAAGQAGADAKVGEAVGSAIGNIGGLATYAAGRYGSALNGYFAGTPTDAAIVNAPANSNGTIITGRKAGSLT